MAQLTELDFDGCGDLRCGIFRDLKLLNKARARFAEGVNNVLGQYNRSRRGVYPLHRFKLRFDLDFTCKSWIHGWIRFALSNQGKVLELDFRPAICRDSTPHCPSRSPYVLDFLEHEVLVGADFKCSMWNLDLGHPGSRSSSSWYVGLKYLGSLYLNRFSVTGETIEYLLAHCPALERLRLQDAQVSHRLRISGQSLKLKHFHMNGCTCLEHLEICDTNLVSFTYVGSEVALRLDNVPHLIEVCIGHEGSRRVDVMSQLSSCLSRLHILRLDYGSLCTVPLNFPRILPELTNLKQLELTVTRINYMSLLQFIPLIEACRYLQRFVAQLKSLLTWPWPTQNKRRRLKRILESPLRYLKEVEIHGYAGQHIEMGLINYLIENAVALEKLVMCPEPKSPTVKTSEEARQCAKQKLQHKLPEGIELMII